MNLRQVQSRVKELLGDGALVGLAFVFASRAIGFLRDVVLLAFAPDLQVMGHIIEYQNYLSFFPTVYFGAVFFLYAKRGRTDGSSTFGLSSMAQFLGVSILSVLTLAGVKFGSHGAGAVPGWSEIAEIAVFPASQCVFFLVLSKSVSRLKTKHFVLESLPQLLLLGFIPVIGADLFFRHFFLISSISFLLSVAVVMAITPRWLATDRDEVGESANAGIAIISQRMSVGAVSSLHSLVDTAFFASVGPVSLVLYTFASRVPQSVVGVLGVVANRAYATGSESSRWIRMVRSAPVSCSAALTAIVFSLGWVYLYGFTKLVPGENAGMTIAMLALASIQVPVQVAVSFLSGRCLFSGETMPIVVANLALLVLKLVSFFIASGSMLVYLVAAALSLALSGLILLRKLRLKGESIGH